MVASIVPVDLRCIAFPFTVMDRTPAGFAELSLFSFVAACLQMWPWKKLEKASGLMCPLPPSGQIRVRLEPEQVGPLAVWQAPGQQASLGSLFPLSAADPR